MLEKILLIVLIISLIFIFMVIIISPIFAWIIYKKIFDQRFIKEKYLKYYTAEELGLEKNRLLINQTMVKKFKLIYIIKIILIH